MSDENSNNPNQPRPAGQQPGQSSSQPGQSSTQSSGQPAAGPQAGADPEPSKASGSCGDNPGNQAEIEQLQAENAELREKYIRLMADMDNLRKRTEREKKEIAKYAISDFARDVLTLGDNFQLAINAVPREAAEKDEALRSFLEGVEMNERELQKMLARYGVNRIDPKGERFDPNFHQAVQQVERPDLPNDTVCDVFQVGYMIADRVLRPAVVSVAKGGPRLPPLDPDAVKEKGPSVPLDAPHDDAPQDDRPQEKAAREQAGESRPEPPAGEKKAAAAPGQDAGQDGGKKERPESGGKETAAGLNIDRKA